MNAHQARKHTRKVRAGQPVPLQLHRVDTSLLPEGTTCTVAGRCTHDCSEGRSCPARTPATWRGYWADLARALLIVALVMAATGAAAALFFAFLF